MLDKVLLSGAAIGLTLFLASCATLSQQECEAGDWRAVGMSDGANGYPASRIEDHNSACSDYNISVNRELYEAGRQDGLRSYCRLERAERDGLRGRRNYNSCQGEIGIAFNRVYDAANEVYRIDAQINSSESNLDGLSSQLYNNGLTDDQRAVLLSRIDSALGRIDNLERERWALQRDLERTRRWEELRLQAAGVAY